MPGCRLTGPVPGVASRTAFYRPVEGRLILDDAICVELATTQGLAAMEHEEDAAIPGLHPPGAVLCGTLRHESDEHPAEVDRTKEDRCE